MSGATIIRADARSLPLADASVDLIVTSPPYFALRSYSDGGEHYVGQVGSEPTPAEFIEALLDCTREMVRVLKPTGSIWVNLGDKYNSRAGGQNGIGHATSLDSHGRTRITTDRDRALARRGTTVDAVPVKSLMLLPERYRIACVDQLGLIARAVVIWSKPNGLPESVTDRVRRSHEDWVHLTKQPRYFAAVDEIREPQTPANARPNRAVRDGIESAVHQFGSSSGMRNGEHRQNPLGKLPGSVWEIATQPLTVPAELGVDHFAAFPMEWPRRIILGWSPSGICVECGEGSRPVAVAERRRLSGSFGQYALAHGQDGRTGQRAETTKTITGYACACTPYTDHPERRQPTVTPGRNLGRGHQEERSEITGSRHHGNDWPERQPTRDYHLDGWTPPPTRPAVVLDPFGGTGTTAFLADVLGRHGISVDMSADYCRLAKWRTNDPGELAKAMQVEKPPPVLDGQLSLLDALEGIA